MLCINAIQGCEKDFCLVTDFLVSDQHFTNEKQIKPVFTGSSLYYLQKPGPVEKHRNPKWNAIIYIFDSVSY